MADKKYEDMTPEEKFLHRITWNDDDIIITKQAIEVPDEDDEPVVSYERPKK